MTIVTDPDQIIQRLERELEETRNERDGLLVAIAEHVEALGGEGNDAIALRDSLGQIERLLEGKDVDAGLDLQGVSGQVEGLMMAKATAAELAAWVARNCDDGTIYSQCDWSSIGKWELGAQLQKLLRLMSPKANADSLRLDPDAAACVGGWPAE